MATINSKSYSSPKNINLKEGILRFGSVNSSNPFDSTSNGLYINSSNQLIYGSQGTTTILGSGGSVSNFSLNDAYDDGSSITVDAAAVTLAGSAPTSAVLSLTATGATTVPAILIANSGSGNDVTGTSSLWSVTAAGVGTFVGLILGDDQTIAFGASTDATLQWVGASNYLALQALLRIAVTEGNAALTVATGDVAVSDGSLAVTDDDNAASVAIVNATATTADVVTITANGLTTGSALLVTSSGTITSGGEGVLNVSGAGVTTGDILKLDATEGTLNGGNYINCYDDTASATVFKVAEDGAVTITGAGGSNVISVTAGDAVLSDGSLTITDADNAVSLSVTNDTATSASIVEFLGSGVFTGTGSTAFISIEPTGLTSGDAVNVQVNAGTTGSALRLGSTAVATGDGAALEVVYDSATTAGASAGEGIVKVSADGLTTGTALDVTSTAIVLTSGRLGDFSHVSGSITGTLNKSGQLFNIEAERTVTTGTVADDYDLARAIRTSIINGAGTFTATGSVLYVENAVTNTVGTVTDTVKGIEVVMDSLGTGDAVEITHAATGGIALNVIGAATSVDDVLVACTGVKADNKASLQVTNSGATAAGGSILRVINTGTPAAATSYLVDFDYSGATMTNNPTSVFINAGGSTNSSVEINTSGASAANKGMLSLLNTNTGATGVVLHSRHTSTGSAANADAVFTLKGEGLDAGDAATEYGRFEVEIMNVTAGEEDGRFIFSNAANDGTLTQMFQVSPRAGGALGQAVVGSGAGVGYVTSLGAYDLVLDTNEGSSSSSITLVDAANGDIDLSVNGTGHFDVQNMRYETAGITGATTLTWGDANGQLVRVDSSGGAYSVTLPAAATVGAGGWYRFVKTDSSANAVTLDGNGAETINGSATHAGMDAQYDFIEIVTDGSNWFVSNVRSTM